MKRCFKCGRPIEPGKEFCPTCGKPPKRKKLLRQKSTTTFFSRMSDQRDYDRRSLADKLPPTGFKKVSKDIEENRPADHVRIEHNFEDILNDSMNSLTAVPSGHTQKNTTAIPADGPPNTRPYRRSWYGYGFHVVKESADEDILKLYIGEFSALVFWGIEIAIIVIGLMLLIPDSGAITDGVPWGFYTCLVLAAVAIPLYYIFRDREYLLIIDRAQNRVCLRHKYKFFHSQTCKPLDSIQDVKIKREDHTFRVAYTNEVIHQSEYILYFVLAKSKTWEIHSTTGGSIEGLADWLKQALEL